MCDGIALEGLRMASRALPQCFAYARRVSEGEVLGGLEQMKHLQAREQMMTAALMGAVAFQKGLGVTHSCAHSLSTVVDMHHGLANGILVPYTMAFNQQAVSERMGELSFAVGMASADGEGFIEWLRELKRDLDIPTHLREAGVEPSHVDELVRFAKADGCHELNPRAVSEANFRGIFEEALGA